MYFASITIARRITVNGFTLCRASCSLSATTNCSAPQHTGRLALELARALRLPPRIILRVPEPRLQVRTLLPPLLPLRLLDGRLHLRKYQFGSRSSLVVGYEV
jgi:hypothetical protein